MDYQDLKVAELRSLCMERGIAVPAKATKAKLVEWLEAADRNSPIEVEAVTVDEEIIPANALAIDYEAIKAKAVELTHAMDSASTALGELTATPEELEKMSLADMRTCRDGLRDARKEVDELRLELGRRFSAPKKAVDAECLKLLGKLDEEIERYAGPINDAVRAGYEAQYIECCEGAGMESLPRVLPFDEFMALHPRWSAVNANAVKVQERIKEAVVKAAGDWEKLRRMQGSMAFYGDAQDEFFKTLDLEAAIEANARKERDRARSEAMERERQEQERWMAEQAAKRAQEQPAPAWTPEFVEVEPEPAPTPEQSAGDAYAREAALMREITGATVLDGHPNRRRYHFEAWLDDAELRAFKDWKNAEGIGDGWTFREVRNG